MSSVDFFTSMEVSASGLAAQRTRMNVAASNLANVETTGPNGPYQRRDVALASDPTGQDGVFAVQVSGIQEDLSPPRLEYDPGHPDADADGNVAYPNISPVEQMVDMITASRAYEAGVTALNTAVSMAERALAIGK